MPVRMTPDEEETPFGDADSSEIIYEVKRGDTLSKIALHFYGDAKKYTIIAEANSHLIKDPNLIQVGWRLKIPSL
ncbi:MAG: LysM peptidoglycan-binding domain-containing protein [Bacteroidia bacterium]|nr:LysM peptidoglycan-binding domain-containing protein [Bacteroidia bacterium]